jgi:DNA-binding transcriptional regulator YiaG
LHTNTEQLLEIITSNNLSTKDIAALLGRTNQTVRIWRSKTGHRVIPDHQLELLKLKLAKRRQDGV